jgi:hypothetical protein
MALYKEKQAGYYDMVLECKTMVLIEVEIKRLTWIIPKTICRITIDVLQCADGNDGKPQSGLPHYHSYYCCD